MFGILQHELCRYFTGKTEYNFRNRLGEVVSRKENKPPPLRERNKNQKTPPWPSSLPPAASTNSGDSQARQGNFLLPGASAAALVMFGVLHARHMYNDKKLVERKNGIEPEFSPDLKASFFMLLPLRSMSRFWDSLMEVEVPVSMRHAIYKA